MTTATRLPRTTPTHQTFRTRLKVFGWTYGRRGLVAAMVAHTSTDVVLHGPSRLVIPGRSS